MVRANFCISLMVLLIEVSVYHAYPNKLAWPKQCKERTYCHIKPAYYPTNIFENLLKEVNFDFTQEEAEELGNRFGGFDDVANCPRVTMLNKYYLILDQNNRIRFVAQNDDMFAFEIQVEECSHPGRTYSSFLDENKLRKRRVECYETRHPIKFPVLSLDGTKLESVTPKGGVPVSCSAKVIN